MIGDMWMSLQLLMHCFTLGLVFRCVCCRLFSLSLLIQRFDTIFMVFLPHFCNLDSMISHTLLTLVVVSHTQTHQVSCTD